MKRIALLFSSLLLLPACAQQESSSKDSFVKDTYIHQYGVTVSKAQWEERGRNGVIVSTDRAGVTSSRNFREGILEGDSTYTFPHSEVVQRVEHYRGGERVKTTANYPNGMPQREEELLGSGVSKRMVWYESGTPASIEEYDNGKLVKGEYRSINNEEVSRVTEERGKRTRFDSYGELIAVDEIREGAMVSSTEYYSNGTPKAHIPYVNDQVHGQKRTFYQGGEPKSTETWTRGERTGVTVVFQNGEKAAEVPYKNGRKHGVEKRYRDGSILAEEITWVQNRRHGPTKVHVASTDRTDWYHQGKLVSQNQYNSLNNKG